MKQQTPKDYILPSEMETKDLKRWINWCDAEINEYEKFLNKLNEELSKRKTLKTKK